MPFDYEVHKARMDRVVIPEKIKCNRCHRIRSNMAYSKRQILALRFELSKGNRSALTGNGVATCNQCTANQAHEMTCCVCDKTKPKEKFSKAQRKNPDAARCYNCLQAHLDAEPLLEEKENDTAPSLSYTQSERAITSSMNNLSLANAAAPPRPKLLDCDTDSDEDGEGSGGVWVEQPSSTAYGTRVGGSAMMSKQAGTNPQSRLPGESQVDTASAASGQISTVETTSGAPAKMHDAWKSYNVTPRPGNAGTAASTNSARKFASSRSMGPRFGKNDKPRMAAEPEQEEIYIDSDSDDSDSDVDIQKYL